jgi:hypothetical protein
MRCISTPLRLVRISTASVTESSLGDSYDASGLRIPPFSQLSTVLRGVEAIAFTNITAIMDVLLSIWLLLYENEWVS